MGKKCLPGVICFENVTIVFIIIIIILIVFYVYKTSHHRIKYIKNNDTYTDHQQYNNNNNNINTRGFVFNNSYMTQPRMNDTLLDPYNPPLVDNSSYFAGGGGDIRGMVMPINIQTQAQRPPPMVMMAASAADNYQQVGLLTIANCSEMILPLM